MLELTRANCFDEISAAFQPMTFLAVSILFLRPKDHYMVIDVENLITLSSPVVLVNLCNLRVNLFQFFC